MLCLYSKGVKSIGEDLHISTDKAQEVYDAVMKAFPDLAKWIKATQEQAKKDNYVDGMFGRRRRLPDLSLPPYEFTYKVDVDKDTKEYYNNYYSKLLDDTYSQDEKQKIILDAKNKGIEIKQNGGFIAKAERECINSIIQGSSSDICKIIIVNIAKNKRLQELGCKLEMSIHD